MLPKRKRYTYQDICEIDDENRYELVDGELYMLSAPLSNHSFISTRLSTALANFLSGKQCRTLHCPVDVFLFNLPNAPADAINYVVQPDIVVVCDPKQKGRRGIYGPPKLVVEVLSKSSQSYDWVVKYNLYEQAGVEEYWIVNPEDGTVNVFQLDGEKYVSYAVFTKDAALHSAAFPGLSIGLSEIFAEW